MQLVGPVETREALDGQPVENDPALSGERQPPRNALGFIHCARQSGHLERDILEFLRPHVAQVLGGSDHGLLEDVVARAQGVEVGTCDGGTDASAVPVSGYAAAGRAGGTQSRRPWHAVQSKLLHRDHRWVARTQASRLGSVGAMTGRPCSKVACTNDAASTLTYDYGDSMAVLGPLSFTIEPHSYDLCAKHSERLSVPQGWQVVRHVVMRDLGFSA